MKNNKRESAVTVRLPPAQPHSGRGRGVLLFFPPSCPIDQQQDPPDENADQQDKQHVASRYS